VPSQGFVAVPPFTSALIDAARRRGAVVRTATPVVRVRRTSAGFTASAPGATLAADVVVICAGSWTGRLDLGREAPRVRPIRGQLLYLRPQTPLFSRILWGPRCYLVPWADGSVLVGATVEDVGFDEQTTASGVAGLIGAAIELVPGLASAALTGARAGLRPMTPDELPVLGAYPDEPGLLFATGHYRNGALLAPLTARIMADLIVEGRAHPALRVFGPQRG
jgi:glycine oxidase